MRTMEAGSRCACNLKHLQLNDGACVVGHRQKRHVHNQCRHGAMWNAGACAGDTARTVQPQTAATSVVGPAARGRRQPVALRSSDNAAKESQTSRQAPPAPHTRASRQASAATLFNRGVPSPRGRAQHQKATGLGPQATAPERAGPATGGHACSSGGRAARRGGTCGRHLSVPSSSTSTIVYTFCLAPSARFFAKNSTASTVPSA